MTNNEMSEKERELYIAALRFLPESEASLAKMSWAIGSLVPKPDNIVYDNLKRLQGELFEVENGYEEEIREHYSRRIEHEEDRLEDRLGEVVTVEVVAVKTFGLICRVEGTTRTLLLHISKIANTFVDDPANFAPVGDVFEAKLVLNPEGGLALSAIGHKPLERKN